MVEMIARKQVEIGRGHYASRGERFSVPEQLAKSLAARGLADYAPGVLNLTALRPLVGYETKDVLPIRRNQ